MKLVRYILLIALTSLLVWGVVWAHGKAENQVCKKVDIEIVNATAKPFVTPQGIMEDLKHAHVKLEGLPMWQINSDKVERLLSASPYLESVDCIKGQDGHFVIRARQLVPVMRVMDGDESYYVNREGKRMNAVGNYYCDVPVVNGHFTRAYGPERLVPLLDYVQHDPTLNSIVTMIDYRSPSCIYIVPCFVGQIIDFGSVANYENKFKKLLLFYQKVMPARGWNTYDTISVKWLHQVVATRRVKNVEPTMVADPDDDEIAPDATTITVTDDQRAVVRDEGTTHATPVKESAKHEANKAPAESKKPEAESKKKDNNNKQPEAKKPDKKSTGKKTSDKKDSSRKDTGKKDSSKKSSDSKKSSKKPGESKKKDDNSKKKK